VCCPPLLLPQVGVMICSVVYGCWSLDHTVTIYMLAYVEEEVCYRLVE
jgi:hypothetical protein